MSSYPRLGARLRYLLERIDIIQKKDPYPILWDCCCDHGYLGIKVLERQLTTQLNFVDQVPHIIDALKPRLNHIPSEHYQLIAGDVGDLKFTPQQRHLVIIAGIGGENIVKMLETIEQQQPQITLDFLFCPTTTQYLLRDFLSQRHYHIEHEALVTEKGRDYEVLYVQHPQNLSGSPDHIKIISRTGAMWSKGYPEHQRYLSKLIRHYHNQSRTDQTGHKKHIATEYQLQLDKITQ